MITGSARSRKEPVPQPPALVHESMMAKISVSTGPTTKFGMVTPAVAKDMTAKSVGLFCRRAASNPAETPPTRARTSARPPSRSE